jgi:paired amphipathic helix protein Sin3a
VTHLFGEAPDLLEDFKQFLPESAAQARAQQQAAAHNDEAAMMGNARADTAYNQGPSHQQTPRADTSRLPPMGNFAPTPTANRDNKRKRGERQMAGATAAAMPAQMNQEAPTSNVRGNYAQGNGNKVCPSLGRFTEFAKRTSLSPFPSSANANCYSAPKLATQSKTSSPTALRYPQP